MTRRAENALLRADNERLRAALRGLLSPGCGPDCASTCRHVNAKDCTGCEAVVASARAALLDTQGGD